MSGRFVLTARLPPPAGTTLLVRSFGSIYFAGWSRWSGKWVMLANGREESIEPPLWWFLTEQMAAQLAVMGNPITEPSFIPPATRRGQLLLDLAGCQGQSGRRVA